MRKTKDIWPLWMGLRGFYFVYHNDWSDPEIVWHGYVMNPYSLEDPMWEFYAERCKEEGTKTTDEGFVQFCKDEIDQLREYAQMEIDCGNARKWNRALRWKLDVFSSDSPRLRAVPA